MIPLLAKLPQVHYTPHYQPNLPINHIIHLPSPLLLDIPLLHLLLRQICEILKALPHDLIIKQEFNN